MTQKTIGRYEIRSELGRGGMGAVYLAFDPTLERDVALKLLPSYFAQDPEFSSRFAREAKTVAGLDHRAIVAVYDYGEDDVWPYFVMRYMRGGSLKDRLADGPIDLAQASHIVRRVAGALDKAHSKGVIHRDLKPANILYDGEGQPYLGDFGIVRLAESSENFTRTGNALGTPTYMSPEQADALPDVDGRSDVYSLGVVLYEMLAGEPPYQHDSMPRLLMMHLTAPIPNLLEVRPDLPPDVQEVIDKAMAKDRDQRYQTAGEMSAALESVAKAATRPASPPKPAAAPKPAAEEKPAAAQQPPPTPAAQAAPQQSAVPKPATPEPAGRQPAPQTAPRPEQQPAPKPAAQPAAPQQAAAQPPASQPTPQPPAAAPAKSGLSRKWIFALLGIVALAVIGVAVIAIVLGSGLFSDSGSSDRVEVVQEEAVPVEEAIEEPLPEPASGPSRLDTIAERGEIIVGVRFNDVFPFVFAEGQGYNGFEIELSREIVDRVFGPGMAISYESLTASDRFPAVQSGQVDMLVRLTAKTNSRVNDLGLLWSSNYFLDGQRLIVRKDSGITDWSESDGAVICAVAGTTTELNLSQFSAAANLQFEVVLFEDSQRAFAAFEEGRCDGFTTDWSFLLALANESGRADQYRVVGDLISSEPLGIAMSDDDPEFAHAIDQALVSIIEDGTWEEIYSHWFSDPPPWSLDQMLAEPPANR